MPPKQDLRQYGRALIRNSIVLAPLAGAGWCVSVIATSLSISFSLAGLGVGFLWGILAVIYWKTKNAILGALLFVAIMTLISYTPKWLGLGLLSFGTEGQFFQYLCACLFAFAVFLLVGHSKFKI